MALIVASFVDLPAAAEVGIGLADLYAQSAKWTINGAGSGATSAPGSRWTGTSSRSARPKRTWMGWCTRAALCLRPGGRRKFDMVQPRFDHLKQAHRGRRRAGGGNGWRHHRRRRPTAIPEGISTQGQHITSPNRRAVQQGRWPRPGQLFASDNEEEDDFGLRRHRRGCDAVGTLDVDIGAEAWRRAYLTSTPERARRAPRRMRACMPSTVYRATGSGTPSVSMGIDRGRFKIFRSRGPVRGCFRLRVG